MDDHELPERLTHRDAGRNKPSKPVESELEAALARRMQDCVKDGTFPLEVQFAMDYFVDSDGLRCRTRVLPSEPPSCPEPVMTVEACYRFHFEQFRQAVIDRIRRDVEQRRVALYSLVSLAQIDRDAFCEVAPRHFADRLESSENEFPDVEHLPLFVLLLHDLDPALPAELLTGTWALSRRAAARLRGMLLDAMDEPQCAEELGLLAAQTLRDRLEEA